jgi:hypothetical protein
MDEILGPSFLLLELPPSPKQGNQPSSSPMIGGAGAWGSGADLNLFRAHRIRMHAESKVMLLGKKYSRGYLSFTQV